MDFFNIGDHINAKDLNAITYLLRKFKRLNAGLKLGSLTLESDYGFFVFDKPLTSVGGNFIIEQEINISSSDCLKNCFYSFIFSVIDVNTSGLVNKRTVEVTGNTGDDGTLFVTLPTDLIESDEVILPDFELDIIFDEHEYYTPIVSVVNVELESDVDYVFEGETATVTATLTDSTGDVLVGVPCNFIVNGTIYSKTTNSSGQATYQYTGTGSFAKIEIKVITSKITIYDSPLTATVNESSISLGIQNRIWLHTAGDVLIDWGDGTYTTVNNPTMRLKHTYTDGLTSHDILFLGNVTSLGNSCFYFCAGLTSVMIPDSVTSLGYDCFYYCTGLTTVVIPDSVTSLGDACFYNCTGLTSVMIPDSVTSLGNACFYKCNSLADYQLYWENGAILSYNDTDFVNNTNTFFTIPTGQTSNYIAKNYPSNKLIEADRIQLSTDKTVISDDETATLTAKLYLDRKVASGKTISYAITNNGETIDSGTDTTDSNGEIEIEYIGDSLGEISITVTYNTLTSNIVIYDTLKYDNATTTDHNDIWTTGNGTLTRGVDGTTLAESTIGTTATATTNIASDTIVDFEFCLTGGNINLNATLTHISQSTTARATVLLKNISRNILLNTWYKVRLILTNDNLKIINLNTGASTNKAINNTFNRFRFLTGGDITALKFRNVRIYPMGEDTRLATTVSLSASESTIYSDESVTFTGALVDEDSTPIESASVKLYRGTSLVDTLTTDSDGEFSKSVTGLSAGTYSFKAVYDGDSTYNSSQSSTVSVTVNNHSYALSIASDESTIIVGNSVTISGTLTKDSSPYASQSVGIYDGSTLVDTVSTDANGDYEKVVSGLSVGVHTFKATSTNAESTTVSVTVTAHTYGLTCTSDKQSMLTTESAVISGTYTVDGTGVSGETVTIYDGATSLGTTTTGTGGAYSKTISSLSAGTHTIKASHTNVDSTTVSITVSEPTHSYVLALSCSTPIIQSGSGASVVATLTDNNVAVVGETLDYEIKHGSTTISTGTTTQTDQNGQATISYTGTGVGDVSVIVSNSGMSLQETFVLEDCWYFNDGSTVTGLEADSGVSCTSNGSYITITKSTSGEKYVYLPVTLTNSDEWEYSVELAEIGVMQSMCLIWNDNSFYGGYTNSNTQWFANNGTNRTKNQSASVGDVYTVTRDNGVTTAEVNTEQLTSDTVNHKSSFKVGFYVNPNRTQYYKNIKLKAL